MQNDPKTFWNGETRCKNVPKSIRKCCDIGPKIVQMAAQKVKGCIRIKNFGFALRLRTFVQKFLTWGHNPQPQPQTQPSDHGSWICMLRWRRRGLRPLGSDHKMQIQDPWSDGCGCGLCSQVKSFCNKVLNLRAKPKFLMHITAFTV